MKKDVIPAAETSLPVIQIPGEPDFIDFGNGEPALSLLPLDLMRQASESCFAQGDPAVLQYGTEQGNGYFRQALAEFLTQGYGFPVHMGELFVTNGSSMGLNLVCSLFTRPGDIVFVEEPTYFLAFHTLGDHGLQTVSLPTDSDGLVIEALEEALKTVRPKFIYVIPTFQNPTGHTLSEARRRQLARLSREHDFLVVADEVYHFLNYQAASPAPMAAFIDQGHIISLNSFSKILAPGLRLGWIQAEAGTLKRFIGSGLLDSGGGMNPFTSAVVRYVIESGGLAQNIERLKVEFGARVAAMDGSIRLHLPQAEFAPPQGGYFFWLRLPGVDTVELRAKARAHKVSFHPGRRFSGQEELLEYLRLSYVNTSVSEIEAGLLRLSRALAEDELHSRH